MSTIVINTISRNDINKFSHSNRSKIIMDGYNGTSETKTNKDMQVSYGKRKTVIPKNEIDDEGLGKRMSDRYSDRKLNGHAKKSYAPIKVKSEEEVLKEIKRERELAQKKQKELEKLQRKSSNKKHRKKHHGTKSPHREKSISPRAERRSENSRRHYPRESSGRRSNGYYRSDQKDRNYSSERHRYEKKQRKSSNGRRSQDRSGDRYSRNNSYKRPHLSDIRRSKEPADMIRPTSPHRHRKNDIGIKISGSSFSETEIDELDTSEYSSNSRDNIKERKSHIDSLIEDKYPGNDFSPEDDEHLADAIKIALQDGKEQSIEEALESGHKIRATFLESMRRPNEFEQAVEILVSKRREKIRQSKRSYRSSDRNNKNRRSGSNRPHKKKTISSRRKPKRVESEKVKEEPPSITSMVNAALKSEEPEKTKEVLDQQKINEALDLLDDMSDDPLIETMDEEDLDEVVPEEPEKDNGGSNIVFEMDEIPGFEDDVPLPNATKSRKGVRKIQLGLPDAIGQQEELYDPLGAEIEFGTNGAIGDDLYEESSEDEGKLTIEEKKDEMLYRFRLVKEAYPKIALPRITRRMKLAKMVRLYEHVMSRIKLKVKTNNYKIFLIGGFFIVQFLVGKIGFDTSGYAVNQANSMRLYERMLREMGESDWNGFSVDLPVMVRLPLFMGVNMAIFLVAKWIFKKTGKDYSDEFHKLYSQLTGGDDYAYINENNDNGMGEQGEGGLASILNMFKGGDGEGGGKGIFGMLKSFMGMMGGGNNEDKPKRGETGGPSYKRRGKRKKKK